MLKIVDRIAYDVASDQLFVHEVDIRLVHRPRR